MRLLLDTHVVLWWLTADRRLASQSRQLIASANDVVLSAASVWEIAIMQRLGKLRATDDVIDSIDRMGLRVLPIGFAHAVAAANLPLHHRDPFDRMLVAQARAEALTLMTADPWIEAYEVDRIAAS